MLDVQRQDDPTTLSANANLSGSVPSVTGGNINGSLLIDGQSKGGNLGALDGWIRFGRTKAADI